MVVVFLRPFMDEVTVTYEASFQSTRIFVTLANVAAAAVVRGTVVVVARSALDTTRRFKKHLRRKVTQMTP